MRNDLETYVHDLFHRLHAVPEVAMQEYKTAALLAEEIRKYGYTVTEGVGGTGLIAQLDSNKPGPVIGLRADIDALVYQVGETLECRHTCGHDAHAAMVLGAAREAARRGLASGRLVIVFQPGEEPILGALAMIDSGLLDPLGIEELYGAHVRPIGEMEVGTATPALYHSASGRLRIRLTGKRAPLTQPEEGANAVHAAVLAVHAVNAVHMDPTIQYSVKTTHMNVRALEPDHVPDYAEIIVDLKHQDTGMYERMQEKTIAAVSKAAAAVGAETAWERINYVPGAAYHEDAVETARQAIVAVLGEKGCLEPRKTTGGDDFHYFVRHLGCKATYFGLGADASPGLHHQDMRLNLACLPNGVRIFSRIIESRLGYVS